MTAVHHSSTPAVCLTSKLVINLSFVFRGITTTETGEARSASSNLEFQSFRECRELVRAGRCQFY